MAIKELTAFRIEPEIMNALRRVKDRDGVPLSVQVDRALRAWVDKKGIPVKKPQPASRKAPKRSGQRTR
jgi:antitoxin component of RelBE/YafQ-DinJ toxin-antitoxin module